MAGRLLQELRQTKPFPAFEEEVVLNIVRTAELVSQQQRDFLKPYDLSAVQYNLLRILRGAEPHGATCSEISERMVTRDPDITRLLDRMETRGLVARQRSETDRRIVMTRISRDGLKLVQLLDAPLRQFLKSKVGKMSRPEQEQLVSRLEQIRDCLS